MALSQAKFEACGKVLTFFFINYEKKMYIVMVNNFTNINKTITSHLNSLKMTITHDVGNLRSWLGTGTKMWWGFKLVNGILTSSS